MMFHKIIFVFKFNTAGMESYSLDAQDSQPDGLPTSPHHTGRVLTDFAQKFIRISRPSASNSEGIR